MDAQVAPETFDRIVAEIAVAAEQLERVVDDLAAIVGREPLRHRREARLVGGVRGDLCRRHIEQGARGFEVSRHVGEHELRVLEIGDRLAELLAVLGIGDRFVEAALRAAERAGTDVEASAVEPRHRKAESVALGADEVFDGDAAILEDHLGGRRSVPAELFLGRAEAEARRVLFDDEAADPLRLFLAGADHADVDVVITGARDELLRAVQHIMVAVALRRRLERRGVGPRTRFGEAIARDLLHADEVGQEARLDLGPAETVDHPGRHIVDRDIGAGRGAAIGHRLHDQRRFHPAEPDAARFLADVNRAEAQLARRLPHVDGIMMFLVPFGREGRDAVGGEFARHILDGELVVGKLELVGHGHFSMMASASISTFHSGRISAGTTSIVDAGRTFLNADPCARPTRSASAASVIYMRVRTTSAKLPPSASSASPIIVMQRAACAPASPGVELPSGSIGAQPATSMRFPTRTARL
eukprot:Opistho-2@86090